MNDAYFRDECYTLDLPALMRAHHLTIRSLAEKMGITMKRVRELRAKVWWTRFLYEEIIFNVTGFWPN